MSKIKPIAYTEHGDAVYFDSQHIEFGARVIIDEDESIIGRVTAFMLRPTGRKIEVSWFNNGSINTSWFDEWRIKVV